MVLNLMLLVLAGVMLIMALALSCALAKLKFRYRVQAAKETYDCDDKITRLHKAIMDKMIAIYLFEEVYEGHNPISYRPYIVHLKAGTKIHTILFDDVSKGINEIVFARLNIRECHIDGFFLNTSDFTLIKENGQVICKDELNTFLNKPRESVAFYAIVQPNTVNEISSILTKHSQEK